MFFHSGISPDAWAKILYAAQGLLVLAAGGLLGAGLWPPLGALALFLLLDARSAGPQYPQSLFAAMVLIAAGLMIDRARAPSRRKTVLLALTLGSTFLFRSTLIFFPPLLALLERRAAKASERGQLWILAALPYLFLLPTLALNWSLHRELVPLERGAASFNVVTGALGISGTADGTVEALIGDPSVDPRRTGSVLVWAAGEILRRPLRYLDAVGRRLVWVFSFNPLLCLLAAAGLWLRRGRPEQRALALLSCYYALIHCLMSVQDDYFIPLWPLLCLSAASLAAGSRPAAEKSGPLIRGSGLAVRAGLALMLGLSGFTSWRILFAEKEDPSDASRALRALDAAVLAHPRDTWLLEQRGELRLRQDRTAEALEDFSKTAELDPRESARLKLAGILASRGDYARVEAWRLPGAAHARGEFPYETTFAAFVLKAQVHLRRGRADEARRLLAAARDWRAAGLNTVRQASTEHEMKALAALRAADARFEEAAFDLSYYWPPKDRMALLDALGARDAGSWIALAEDAARRGDRTVSALALKRGMKGADDRALRRAALAYQNMKEYGRAVGILAGLARRSPGDASLLSDKGLCEYLNGSESAALADLRAAIRLDPGFLPAYLTLGAVHAAKGRASRALEVYDEALSKAAPANPLREVVTAARAGVTLLSK